MSGPAQLTMGAGTAAVSNRIGMVRMMSSVWIGLNWLGRCSCSGMDRPAAIASRWIAGQPPWSPYGTLSRAMTVGMSSARAMVRTTASAPILPMV